MNSIFVHCRPIVFQCLTLHNSRNKVETSQVTTDLLSVNIICRMLIDNTRTSVVCVATRHLRLLL